MDKQLYKEWVNKAYDYIVNVFPATKDLPYVDIGSTQFIPTLDGDIDFVFLGHDAHEGLSNATERMCLSDWTKRRFFEGNGSPRDWRKCPEWKIWNNFESALAHIGFTEIMSEQGGKLLIDDMVLNKSIVTNALLFNYNGRAVDLEN